MVTTCLSYDERLDRSVHQAVMFLIPESDPPHPHFPLKKTKKQKGNH